MNNGFYDERMIELKKLEKSGKIRTIIGIIALSISMAFTFARFIIGWGVHPTYLNMMIYIGTEAVAGPLLVTGIIRMTKADTLINLIKSQQYVVPQHPQPIFQKPNTQHTPPFPPFQQPVVPSDKDAEDNSTANGSVK